MTEHLDEVFDLDEDAASLDLGKRRAKTAQGRQSRKARAGSVGPERTRRSAVGTLRNGEKLNNADARDMVLKGILHGRSVKDSVAAAQRSYTWYETQRREDDEFRAQVTAIRMRTGNKIGPLSRDAQLAAAHDPMLLDFPAFCAKYLGQQVFPHTQNIVDMIEGRAPSWLHPAMLYEPGERDLMIANCPPEHCAVLSTPVLTANRGWTTVGEVTGDDRLWGADGQECLVLDTWRPEAPVPTYEVRFSTGEAVEVDAGHKWIVYPTYAGDTDRATARELRTDQIMASPQRWTLWNDALRSASRSIVSVTPTGRQEMVQCISVTSPSNEYLIGDGLIPSRNAKSVAVTINYVTYRICMDPSVRIIIVSKSQSMAKKMLLAIKNRLTSPRYSHLIATYGPLGGFEADSDAWTSEMIYVGGRDVEQKDPTVQAIGIRGHLYGARADLIVMDDCVDMTNYLDYDRQIEWIQAEVVSRISANGALLVVGTRLSQNDLYLELRNPQRYPEEVSPWTYLSMPAVLDFGQKDPENWVTLWPRTNVADAGDRTSIADDEGLYPKWDGPRLARKRARVSPQVWARVYQQQQVASDTVFTLEDVRGCICGSRNVGRIQVGMPNNRAEGMNGLMVLAGLDPATTGFTAATVLALDPQTFKRYVLDVRNRPGLSPDELRELIYELTEHYGVNEWVIERNGFQGFLAYDREVNEFLRTRGCLIRAHYTSQNKHDPDFGVAAMSSLFRGWREGNNLIELPSPHASEGVKALIEQLSTWAPRAPKGLRTDTVMSLWFAELACQSRVEALSAFSRSHARNPFLTRADRSRQQRFSAIEAQSMWAAM